MTTPASSHSPRDSPDHLVEHFFRHESGKLVAVLTRAFGVGRLELVEDAVQSALVEAMHAWSRGVPDNPGGWVHRVARNRVLDALRRERVHRRALALSGQSAELEESLVAEWLDDDTVPDSLLRMMFVCCHPTLERPSQIALTLKILCGFGVGEIARALLMSTEAVTKRIQRAKRRLAEGGVTLDPPTGADLVARREAVHDVLYLLFNEGYSPSRGPDPIRDDVCEEAARLCHLLCEHGDLASPATRALLALMLFHGARLESRTDADGLAVPLEDQDRRRWDWRLVKTANDWLERAHVKVISRFHLEAGIAREYCRSTSLADIDWPLVVRLYDRLVEWYPSPLYDLNRAIARGQLGEIDRALAELDAVRARPGMDGYVLVDCARARLHHLNGDPTAAAACYRTALAGNVAPHERAFVERRLAALEKTDAANPAPPNGVR